MRTRRAFLAALGLPAMAGCTRAAPAGARTPTTAGPNGPTRTEDLDRREANVVGVAFDSAPGEDVRFAVTLFHDDGEGAYANWWPVESLDGKPP